MDLGAPRKLFEVELFISGMLIDDEEVTVFPENRQYKPFIELAYDFQLLEITLVKHGLQLLGTHLDVVKAVFLQILVTLLLFCSD